MIEKFVLINGFDHYAISNFGRIKNVRKDKILTPTLLENGYLSYVFCQNGIKKGFRLHRLVALYFLDNPENKPYVNHKDGDKTNNVVTNLEWCTAQENQIHARTTGLINQEKPIVAVNIDSGDKTVFKSVTEAGAILQINKGTIVKVLKGRRNKVHNYTFYYV